MILQGNNLHKIYNHDAQALHVLRGVHLQVAEGDVLTIVGPSGAGKSTLLHILGGLDRPTEGKVILDGQDVYGLDENKRALLRNERIGLVFQFYHLMPEFTALENVMLPAMVKGSMGRTELRTHALDLLRQVGLAARANHRPNQLSGGEQQRVAIARSLINRPKIIFCDEPTGNLDSQSGEGIIQLLLELNTRNKQTLVIVTHDEQIAKRSHKTVHMRDGMLIDSKAKTSNPT